MCFHKVRRGIGAASSWLHRPVRWQAWLKGPPPTLPKVDKIDGPCDRIEAENRKRDLSPVATQREEPAARLALTREVFFVTQQLLRLCLERALVPDMRLRPGPHSTYK